MKKIPLVIFSLFLATQMQELSFAGETQFPPDHQANAICPAPKLLPILDAAYHECHHGFVNGSCEKFVETFRQLLPEYDCQRPFDKTGTVPAIWLANSAAEEDYVELLWRLSSSRDKMYLDKLFSKATSAAKRLFGSKEFRNTLDGAMAEDYLDRSIKVEKRASAK